MNNNNIKELAKLCEKDLNIRSNKDVKKSDLTFFKRWLGDKILKLLETDFNQLINALYRIDVSEDKSKHAFKAIDNETIASNLAELIIERQLEKLEWRRKYST